MADTGCCVVREAVNDMVNHHYPSVLPLVLEGLPAEILDHVGDAADKCLEKTLKKLRTSKGNFWIKQGFSSIASHFKGGGGGGDYFL